MSLRWVLIHHYQAIHILFQGTGGISIQLESDTVGESQEVISGFYS